MKSIYSFYSKFISYLDSICRGLLFVILILMLTIVNLEIISRSFFHYSFTWIEEVAKYLVVWTAFLGGICAVNLGTHPTITALIDRFNGKFLTFFSSVVQLISISSLTYMGVLGFNFTMTGFSLSMTALPQVPMAYIYMIIPFGCFGMSLCMINKMLETLLLKPEGNVEVIVEKNMEEVR